MNVILFSLPLHFTLHRCALVASPIFERHFFPSRSTSTRSKQIARRTHHRDRKTPLTLTAFILSSTMVFSLDTTKTTNTTSAADPSYSTLQETSNYSNRNNSTSRKSCIPSSYSTAEITTMYRSPGRASTPHKPPLPNGGPIADFCAVIESTPADQWQLRSAALRTVVDSIPDGAAYAEIGDAGYNSPPILRHLSIPVGELLKDARSTVVKRTCESLTRLFL